MSDSWTHETEHYRYATPEDMPAFNEPLSDAEVGRSLWFAPIQVGAAAEYFGPFLHGQAKELAAGETPLAAVFALEELSGEFLGQGPVVAV